MLKPYTNLQGERFTGAEREAGSKRFREAWERGEWEPTGVCARCGQNEGIIMRHQHDYRAEDLTKTIEELCWRCHMVHHSRHRAPEACAVYWELILTGHRFPPVFKHDFSILARDHGIT